MLRTNESVILNCEGVVFISPNLHNPLFPQLWVGWKLKVRNTVIDIQAGGDIGASSMYPPLTSWPLVPQLLVGGSTIFKSIV